MLYILQIITSRVEREINVFERHFENFTGERLKKFFGIINYMF